MQTSSKYIMYPKCTPHPEKAQGTPKVSTDKKQIPSKVANDYVHVYKRNHTPVMTF